ncbi:unnamed protein product [Rotaria magnacalcarata]|uniref:Uncharacterized protein n=1 Tax=Rotaria magnacalcarata TaxID=392030 RepID=A0A8S3DNE9_9BILA|nr:unnamed protein product [Rotaria magnacalcarata]CAF4103901.1 unnamed protein product [Rotaria magnacalcarata]CAF5015552.1 unnamed protein product [Rotaria magnacalcarata]
MSISLHYHVPRDKSRQSNGFRSKSQPSTEQRSSIYPPLNPIIAHPMKTYFENILHLTPYRFITPSNSFVNRTRISPSSSIFAQSDRSSHAKTGQPSVVSVYSNHSINVNSFYDNRFVPSKLTLKFRRAGNLVLFAIYWCKFARKKNQQRSVLYQSYLQTVGSTEKYMFDKSKFKIQSVRKTIT